MRGFFFICFFFLCCSCNAQSACRAGTYLATGGATCLACGLNTTTSSLNATTCSFVGTNAIKSLGLNSTTECPTGSQPVWGYRACVTCPRGSVPRNDSSQNSTTTTNFCQACSDPHVFTDPFDIQCRQCPRSDYEVFAVNNATGPCTPCPLYTNRTSSNTTCGANGLQFDGRFFETPTSLVTWPPGKTSIISSSSLADSTVMQFLPIGTYRTPLVNGGFTVCPAGSFNNHQTGSVTTCPLCPRRTYQANEGASTCLSCSAGKWSAAEGRTTDCTQTCESGSGLTSDLSACVPCPIGTARVQLWPVDNGTLFCEPCKPGRQAHTVGSIQCNLCESGKYQSHPGQALCVDCPAGTFSSSLPQNRTRCEPCPRPRVTLVAGSTSCSLCTAPLARLTPSLCAPCPANHYRAADGDGCLACPLGFISSPGSTSCTENTNICPVGHFLSPATKICTPCPHGLMGNGSTCAECQPGFAMAHVNDTVCTPCPTLFYRSTGMSKCQLCPLGTVVNANRSACTACPAGRHRPDATVTVCSDCPENRFAASPGTVACTRCPVGQWTNGQTGKTSCQTCPVGLSTFSDGFNCTEVALLRRVLVANETMTEPVRVAVQVASIGFPVGVLLLSLWFSPLKDFVVDLFVRFKF